MKKIFISKFYLNNEPSINSYIDLNTECFIDAILCEPINRDYILNFVELGNIDPHYTSQIYEKSAIKIIIEKKYDWLIKEILLKIYKIKNFDLFKYLIFDNVKSNKRKRNNKIKDFQKKTKHDK